MLPLKIKKKQLAKKVNRNEVIRIFVVARFVKDPVQRNFSFINKYALKTQQGTKPRAIIILIVSFENK